MHTATFKTYVQDGSTEPKELSVEYIPEVDMLIFSVAGEEVFNINYTDNLETIVRGIEGIRAFPDLE